MRLYPSNSNRDQTKANVMLLWQQIKVRTAIICIAFYKICVYVLQLVTFFIAPLQAAQEANKKDDKRDDDNDGWLSSRASSSSMKLLS